MLTEKKGLRPGNSCRSSGWESVRLEDNLFVAILLINWSLYLGLKEN